VMWGDAPISAALEERILAWQDAWEATVYLGKPWPSEQARQIWLQEGDELVAAIQIELAPLGYTVIGKFRRGADADTP